MTKPVTLTIAGVHHQQIYRHLFPGDGKEAATIALCGRAVSPHGVRLLVREVIPVPYAACTVRTADRLAWPTAWLDPVLDRAEKQAWSIAKFHSHPTGYPVFSQADDVSDSSLFVGIHSWLDTEIPHASLVMLPDGRLFGRTVSDRGLFDPLRLVTLVGDDIVYWHTQPVRVDASTPAIGRPTGAFGRQMVAEFRRLSAAVVGCSGTGSLVVEQLARSAFGRLVLVDGDTVETKNLNRIVNATASDVRAKRPKVEVFERSIKALEFDTAVGPHQALILDRAAIEAVASCDVLFGCVDTAEGRDVMSRIASCYLLPYIDVGAGAVAAKDGSIDQVDAVIHYIQPGRSSLLSRGAYRPEQVQAEALRRTNPAEYEARRRSKYIEGVEEEQPSVMPINMAAASLAVLEFMGRLYRYRHNDNGWYATVRLNLAEMDVEVEGEGPLCPLMGKLIGQGDREPLLDLPELSAPSSS